MRPKANGRRPVELALEDDLDFDESLKDLKAEHAVTAFSSVVHYITYLESILMEGGSLEMSDPRRKEALAGLHDVGELIAQQIESL